MVQASLKAESPVFVVILYAARLLDFRNPASLAPLIQLQAKHPRVMISVIILMTSAHCLCDSSESSLCQLSIRHPDSFSCLKWFDRSSVATPAA